MWTYMPRAVRGTISRDTTTVLRRMFHVLILNGESRHTMTDKTVGTRRGSAGA